MKKSGSFGKCLMTCIVRDVVCCVLCFFGIKYTIIGFNWIIEKTDPYVPILGPIFLVLLVVGFLIAQASELQEEQEKQNKKA